ncbi:hypothetical protein K2X85_04480 [bacterium]|nr:hypothetical protein [bacterium]
MSSDLSDREWFLSIADKCDYFTLLSVGRDVVDQQTLRLAARSQADRLAPFQIGPDAEHAARILKRIGRAYRTLSDPGRREAYLAKAKGGKRSTQPAGTNSLFEDERLPTLASPEDLFPPSQAIDTQSGIDLGPSVSSPIQRANRSSTGWVTVTSVLFILLNLGILAYWWEFVRQDDRAELRQARQEAIDRRAPDPPPPVAKPSKRATLTEDPRLQPDAFK